MLEQLLQLVKENAGDAIINNPVIPNEHNDAAIETAAGSLFDNLKGAAAGGNLDGIMNLFNQGGDVSNNPLVNNLSSGVAGDLMKKFGLDSGVAGNIVQNLLPVVMNKLVNKTNDPNDSSFDLQGIIGSLTGGSGGIGNMIKGIFG
jgi:uncharacterized protein YidB (DUF937 family)